MKYKIVFFILITQFLLMNSCTSVKMNINKNSNTSPPLLIKSDFIENCSNLKEGDAKILVDTNGIVREVIVVKCTSEDSVYFHTNLFKLQFKPGVFSGQPVAVWINMKFRFCNETGSNRPNK